MLIEPQYLRLPLIAFFVLKTYLVFALDVPSFEHPVNDYGHFLNDVAAKTIEQRLEDFEAKTGHPFAVLTIPSLEGDEIEEFSKRIADNWKFDDDGVIFVISRHDRKIRIQVGATLEKVLPQAVTNRIIQKVITPRFGKGDLSGAIRDGVEAIIELVEPINNRNKNFGGLLVWGVIIGALLYTPKFYKRQIAPADDGVGRGDHAEIVEHTNSDLSCIAGTDLSGRRYTFVKQNACEGPCIGAGTGESSLGILQNNPESGGTALVRTFGISLLVVNAKDPNIIQGDWIKIGANGVGVKGDWNRDIVCALAQMAANTDGEQILVDVCSPFSLKR